MIKLEIVKKSNYEYECQDEMGHNYIMNLEFFDIQEFPKIRRLYIFEWRTVKRRL